MFLIRFVRLHKKLLFIVIGVVVIISVVFAVLFIGNGKIKKSDYTIVDDGALYVTVNRKIGEMSNIECILDDIIAHNESKGKAAVVYYINDNEVYFSLDSGFNTDSKLYLDNSGVCYNIGTVQNPKWGEIDYSKTKELNNYLEKYYGG
jgi:hypothetical protein